MGVSGQEREADRLTLQRGQCLEHGRDFGGVYSGVGLFTGLVIVPIQRHRGVPVIPDGAGVRCPCPVHRPPVGQHQQPADRGTAGRVEHRSTAPYVDEHLLGHLSSL